MASGFTITYTGASPTTISFEAYEPPPSGATPYCLSYLTLNSGDTYYISTNSALSDYTDIQVSFLFSSPNTNYNFSSVCDSTVFRFLGRIGSTPLQTGFTYCLSAFSCTEGVTYSGCYTLHSIGGSFSYPRVSWISEPIYSGDTGGCTGTCACSSASPCNDVYCITYTDTSYDGNYTYAGSYSGYSYWTGDTTPTYYIYNDGDGWCLSNSLGGVCLLSGKSPCVSECPDLCDSFFGYGPCSTTTTTTSPCNIFEFDALFDCEVVPTPSPTPTPTVTPTITVTPSSTNYCSIVGVDASINTYSPTPTPTPTVTPSSTPEITRPCNFSGDVTFTTIDGNIDCPRSLQFQDCLNGSIYYTTQSVTNPSSGEILPFMIFLSEVDGISRCISYIGINTDVIGVNNIVLQEGPIGYSNLGDCILCVPQQSPTPTPTITQTLTPTPTVTPTIPFPTESYYLYKSCNKNVGNPGGTEISASTFSVGYNYIIQTSPGPVLTTGVAFSMVGKKTCWQFISNSTTIPVITPPDTYTTYSGNWFDQPIYSANVYSNCLECLKST